jgi:hypothetical protein
MVARHPLLIGTRWLVPLACSFALAGALMMPSPLARVVAAVMFVLSGLGGWLMFFVRPVLLLDDDGYAIVQRGRERLRVRWSEVLKVRVDKREHALYLDCGDKARNLFVPPRRGYGFRFADSPALCARVLAAVPAEHVVEVDRIDVP